MGRNSQSAALGTVTDFRSSVPVTSKERIAVLENRMEQVERTLNEVLIQLSEITEKVDKLGVLNRQGSPVSHGKSAGGSNTRKPKQNGNQAAKKSKSNGNGKPKYPQNVTREHIALADRIVTLMREQGGEMTRAKISEELQITERDCGIAFSAIYVQKRAVKTERRDDDGNAIWAVT